MSRWLAMAVVLAVGTSCSRPPHHPKDASTEGLPAEVSQPVEFVLATTVGGTGTLLSARVVDASPGLEVVSTGLVQSGDVANGEPYPPRHPVTSLPARYQGSTLVAIAIRADRPGNYDGLGVLLTWRSHGKTHTTYQPMGFRLCVGAIHCNSSAVTKKILALDIDKVMAAASE